MYKINKRIQPTQSSCKNHDLFKNIEDPETQYWLGWLATDGSIGAEHRISLALEQKDSDVIEKYKNFIGTNNKINVLKDKRFEDSIMHTLKFRNKFICETLNDLGITNKKTFTLNLNFPITWEVMRGIIEGDGCFKASNDINFITGSKSFFIQVLDFLLKEGLKPSTQIIKRKSDIYVIDICKNKDVVTFIDKVYKNADIPYSNRKYKCAQLISNYLLKKYPNLREPAAMGILKQACN